MARAATTADVFNAIAEPRRREIIGLLNDGQEWAVGDVVARVKIAQPAVSKHLGVLRRAGLVRDRHEGRQTHYSAQLAALSPLVDWTKQMNAFWESRFDDLENLLKRMDQ